MDLDNDTIEKILKRVKRDKPEEEQKFIEELSSRMAEIQIPLCQFVRVAHEISPEFGIHVLSATICSTLVFAVENTDKALNMLEEINKECRHFLEVMDTEAIKTTYDEEEKE